MPYRSNGYLESAAFGAKSAQYAKFICMDDCAHCADFAFGYPDIRSATSHHKRPALGDDPPEDLNLVEDHRQALQVGARRGLGFYRRAHWFLNQEAKLFIKR
jgi:hypothetical protein